MPSVHVDGLGFICHTWTEMFSTREVAKKLGLQTRTLSRYVQAGKLPAPKMVNSGGMTLHLWTEKDVDRARELLPTIANGRKTRHQKSRKNTKHKT
jgi:excisionase family DNA binding protein